MIYAVVDGRPVFLLSGLAEHTRNLEADPRASLLVIAARPGDGFDLRVAVGNDQTEVRVPFAAPLTDPQRVREELVAMLRDARARLGS